MVKWAIAAVLAAMMGMAGAATAATAVRSGFGALADGTAVEQVTLSNRHGVKATLIAYGAGLKTLEVPGRGGKSASIVLGYAKLSDYVDHPSYFGVTVGRYANRIKDGVFTLNGKTYQLAKNDGPNSLHGGKQGFDKRVWTIANVSSGKTASVTFTRVSPDGEEGYPGALSVSVTYALSDNNELTLSYRATTDAPTVLNLTNHALFNLAGEGSGRDALEAKLTVAADAITPIDATLIPTGALQPVAGTPFDFRHAAVIAGRVREDSDPQIKLGRGIDHNYVLNGGLTPAPKFAARLEDPVSGRGFEIWTTEPGLQVYTGNFLDGTLIGFSGRAYRQGDAIALETQHFPDSPNQPRFPTTRLDPGQTYSQTTIYRFFTPKH